MVREGEGTVPKDQAGPRGAHSSVAGNVGKSGELDTAFWAGSTPGGISLGGYAAARGMSVFTVEPPVNRNIADYGPGGNRAGDKVTQAGFKLRPVAAIQCDIGNQGAAVDHLLADCFQLC